MTTVRRSFAVVAISAVAVAAGGLQPLAGSAASSSPPSCSNTSKNTDCIHAPTSDETAQPASPVTTSYNAKTRRLVLHFSGSITPPYQTCPDGGVPYQDIPCTFRGLTVQARLYMPDGSPAPGVGGDSLSEPSTPGDCQYFTCSHIVMTMPDDYYGPGTVIVNYSVGNLVDGPNGPGAFSSSDYENSFTVRSNPTTDAIHVLGGRSVYSGKPKNLTIKLAGKAGVPRSGVRGVIVYLDGKGAGEIKHADYFGNTIGVCEVVKGTTLKLAKQDGSKGSIGVRVMGYISTRDSLAGALVHNTQGIRKLHVARTISLRKKGVPTDATAGVFAVTTPHGDLTIGGVKVVKSGFNEPTYVMAPLAHGAVVHVHAARGTKISIAGYLEPIHAYDEGYTLRPTYTQQLSDLMNLPEQE